MAPQTTSIIIVLTFSSPRMRCCPTEDLRGTRPIPERHPRYPLYRALGAHTRSLTPSHLTLRVSLVLDCCSSGCDCNSGVEHALGSDEWTQGGPREMGLRRQPGHTLTRSRNLRELNLK